MTSDGQGGNQFNSVDTKKAFFVSKVNKPLLANGAWQSHRSHERCVSPKETLVWSIWLDCATRGWREKKGKSRLSLSGPIRYVVERHTIREPRRRPSHSSSTAWLSLHFLALYTQLPSSRFGLCQILATGSLLQETMFPIVPSQTHPVLAC